MREQSRDYSDSDREFWEEELADFVPQRVFDAHCHLFDLAHMRPDAPPTTRSYADLETLRAWGRLMFPGRRMNFLLLGMPKAIKVLKEIDFNGIIIPDHVPMMGNDPRIGVAYTIGWLKATMHKEQE